MEELAARLVQPPVGVSAEVVEVAMKDNMLKDQEILALLGEHPNLQE